MQLHCQTGYYIAITEKARVIGIRADVKNLPNHSALMEISSAGIAGHIRIRAKKFNYYLAMNKKGRLYGEKEPLRNTTIFVEEMTNGYNTYRSIMSANACSISQKVCTRGSYNLRAWYVALDRRGRAKRGPRTARGQRAVRFMPRRFLGL
ncbi:fibroblast growth factor 10-like [Ctenocephalides felis]|uniref:fibroblast growth factor 10-like n=1 Tax=Ctenocephalides felis TaxID=7515 RepID=UPI000E6E20A5|nr:fibroblast growth factor 10-like [Ctenocephalides felis]